jgi:hypothetical protein
MQTSIILRVDETTKEAFQQALDDRSMSDFLRKKIKQLIENEKNEDRQPTRTKTHK